MVIFRWLYGPLHTDWQALDELLELIYISSVQTEAVD